MRRRGFEVVKRLEGVESEVELPVRSTGKSAGYDFIAFQDEEIPSMLFDCIRSYVYALIPEIFGVHKSTNTVEPYLLRLGVKAYMQDDEVLCLYNRSSNPKKRGMVVANGVGVIDSDFYENQHNDGEIGVLFFNMFPWPVKIKKGDRVCQGIFSKFLKADGDNSTELRIGGYGSTGM